MKKVSSRPLVSVIVPVFDAEKYLDECISSIVGQSYENIEIILVDDGSKDSSPSICDSWKKIDKRVLVSHRKNSGVSEARNYGLSTSKGDYVIFVDADDWLDADYVQILLDNTIKENADISICGINRIAPNGTSQLIENQSIINGRDFLLGILKIRNGFGICYAKIYKADIAKSNSFNKALSVGEDALYNLGVAKHTGRISIINKALYNYRVHSESVVRRYDKNYIKKYCDSMKLAKENLANDLGDKATLEAFYDYVAFHVMLVAVNYCCNPKNDRKRESLKSLYKLDLLKAGIANSNLGSFPKSKQIVLFALKHRLYSLCILLCSLRQRQNRARSQKNGR